MDAETHSIRMAEVRRRLGYAQSLGGLGRGCEISNSYLSAQFANFRAPTK